MGIIGTVTAQIKVDTAQAIAAYTALKAKNAETMSALRSSAGAFSAVGSLLGVAGLAIAGGLAAAATEAAKFNQEMDYFQSVSGDTVSQMNAIKNKALELDQTTMFSVADITQMFVQLAKSGVSTSNILGGVADAIVNLAQAAQINLVSATTDVVTVMSTFNLTAAQAAGVSNEFAGAANNSILSVNDLATSLKYVGGVANQLGITYQDTTTALSLLANAGIAGSMGGTELRQIFTSLLGTTKASATELTKLGIITKDGGNQFFDASGKAKNLSTIFQILQDHLAGLNKEQQLAALKTIFNNRALAAAAILSKDGAAGFDKMNAAISKTTAADVAAARMNNLAGATHQLTSSLKTMAIQAGQPLQQFLLTVVHALSDMVHWFENLSPGTQSAIIHFLAIAAALLLFLSALAKTVAFILKMVELWRDLAAALEIVTTFVGSVMDAFEALGVAMLANPVFLVIAAVVALGVAFYLLYTHVKVFRDAVNDVGRWFMGTFEPVVKWFERVPEMFSSIWKDIDRVFTIGVGWVKGHWRELIDILPFGAIIAVVTKFHTQILNFFENLPNDIEHFFSSAWNAISNFFTQMYDKVVGFFVRLPSYISGGLAAAGRAILTFFENLPYWAGYAIGYVLGLILRFNLDVIKLMIDLGVKAGEVIANFFEALPGKIWNWLVEARNKMIEWENDAITDAETWTVKIAQAIANFFVALPGRLWGWLVDATNKIQQWEDEGIADAESWLSSMGSTIANFFEQLPGKIWNWLVEARNKIQQWELEGISDAESFGLKLLNTVVGFFQRLPGDILTFLNRVISDMGQWATNGYNAAVHFGSQVVSAVTSWIGKLPTVAGQIMNNVITAIENLVSSAFSAAEHFAGGLWNGFKKGLGINSPSFIEKQMTQISQAMRDETNNINGYVKQIQGLGSALQGNNPAGLLSSLGSNSSTGLTSSLNTQLSQLANLQRSLANNVSGYSLAATAGDGNLGAASNSNGTKIIEVNVYNPTAESSAVSTSQQLVTLAKMGAF